MYIYYIMPNRKSQRGGAKAPRQMTRAMQVEKTLKNGAKGKYIVGPNGNPVFRITSGVSGARMAAVRASRGKAPRPLSVRAAKAAFTRHYNSLSHSPRGRAIAKGRDRCSATKPSVRDTRYSKKGGPRRYNYPGVDDGSQCKGTVRRVSKKASPRQAAALARGRATRARNLRAKSPRGAAGRKLKQAGGSRRRSRSRSRSRR